jgi:membrane protease YdiL (CAAX protease family)
MKMEVRKVLLGILAFSLVLFIGCRLLNSMFGYTLALHLGMLSFALFFLYDKGRADFFRKLGIPGDLKKNVLFFIGGMAAILASLVVLTVALSLLGLNDQAQIAKVTGNLPLAVLLLAVFLAPFSEELLFRGLLCSRFGIVLSSIAFAIVHVAYGSVLELAGAFVIGLVLALVFKKSGSILPCIAIHMAYNTMSVVVMKGVA